MQYFYERFDFFSFFETCRDIPECIEHILRSYAQSPRVLLVRVCSPSRVWEKGKNEMDWDTAIRYLGDCKDMMLGNQQ